MQAVFRPEINLALVVLLLQILQALNGVFRGGVLQGGEHIGLLLLGEPQNGAVVAHAALSGTGGSQLPAGILPQEVLEVDHGHVMKLLGDRLPIESLTVMVQKEVADRMQVGPGTKDYGALSLAVQYYAKPEIVANVPPNCFMPRPKVGSAVIKLTPVSYTHLTLPTKRIV